MKLRLLVAIILLLHITSEVAFAATEQDVTVVAEPLWTNGLSSFVVTYISETQIDFSWGFEGDASSIMIRGKYGEYPDDIPDEDTTPSDGYLVYQGSSTSTSDTSLNLDLNPGPIYYRAWAQKASGKWYTTPSEDWKESEILTLLGLILLGVVMSYVSVRATFPLFKYGASVVWIGLLLYIKDNPPGNLAEGDPAHIVIMLALLVLALALPLAQLSRDIRTSRKSDAFDITESGGFKFTLPKWLKGEEYNPQQKAKQREEELDAYRARLHSALNPPGVERPIRRIRR